MVKAKITSTKQEVAKPVAAAAAVQPVVEKPKVKRAVKAVSQKPDSTMETQQSVVAADQLNKVSAGQEEVSEDADQPLAEQSTEFLAKLQQIGALISSLKSEYRILDKKWTRELKTAQKLNSKRKRKSGNRAPSGFVKPTRISDELANFLGKDLGSEMARTEVTRDINKYIRTNNLQDAANGRKINPDAKLASLLKLKKSDELTYFNLQRYMSPHFAKASAAKPESTV